MHWYKIAQQYNEYSIDNLSPQWIQRFIQNPISEGPLKFLPFDLEHPSPENIKEVQKGLRRIWHPDVNKEHSEIAHRLFQSLDRAVNYLLENAEKREELPEEDEHIEQEPGVFESVIVGTYDKDKNLEEAARKYQDISDIPTNLTSSDGDHQLTIYFSSGNTIDANWRNNAGGMWARGNFSTLEDRNWRNFYQRSMKSAANSIADVIISLASAGIYVTGIEGSKQFYNKVKQNVEQIARDYAIRASSMGQTNWDQVENSVEYLNLEDLEEIINWARSEISEIINRYKETYGAKLSNRYMPWDVRLRGNKSFYGGRRDKGRFMLEEAYPILGTLENFSAWVDNARKQKFEHLTPESVKQNLVKTLRMQMEKADKTYPIKNSQNKTYKIVASFYREMDKVVAELLSFFS
jgi:hypothetical protein